MLSHDLRSAIGHVIVGLELMNVEDLDDESTLHRNGALFAARHMNQLIDGIIDIRAIDQNDFVPDLSAVDLDDFLGEIYRTFLGPISAKQLSFEIDKSDTLPDVVELDRSRVLRVIGNLMDNAIKYTDRGGIKLTAGIGQEDELEFIINDEGPGFSDSAMARLFEFRGRPQDSQKPGTGLGLYIAKSLVENMGGQISAYNVLGHGAAVRVSFPTRLAKAVKRRATKTHGPMSVMPNAMLPDLSALNILLAEDNATNRQVVTQMLSAMGAKYEVACDGAEALEKLSKSEFNLALLDIEMPRVSGLDVIRNMRADGSAHKNMPVVALTAYAMREHREKIFEAGADGLIAKPIMGIENFGQEILRYFELNPASVLPPSPSAEPTALTEEVIDPQAFATLAKSIGAEKFDELLGKIRSDLENVAERIQSGLEARNIEMVAAASHILISVAGAIGATRVQNAGQLLNRAAHLNDTAQLERQGTTSLTG